MAHADRTQPSRSRTPFRFEVRAKRIPVRLHRLSKRWRRAQNWNRLQWRWLRYDPAREKKARPDQKLPRDKQVSSWEFRLAPLARKNNRGRQRVFRRIKFLLRPQAISALARRRREECFLRRAARLQLFPHSGRPMSISSSSLQIVQGIGRKWRRR